MMLGLNVEGFVRTPVFRMGVVMFLSVAQSAMGQVADESRQVEPCGSVLTDGLLSFTSPKGYLYDLCDLQREGLTGHPEALCYPYDSCLWAGRIQREGESHGDGWWRYEQTAYYTDGLLRLGYAIEDSEMVKKGLEGIEYTLAHASGKGFLGDPCLWDSDHYKLRPGFEMWPMAVFFRAMKAKYDADSDWRIPLALRNYYLAYSVDTIANSRNIVSVEGMLWAYEKTGDRRLLEKAEAAWNSRTGMGWKHDDLWSGDLTPELCESEEPIYMHGVSCCEELKVPLLLAVYTGKSNYWHQALNAEYKLARDHLLPDGCISSTEQTRGNSVYWGHETCDVSDYTWMLGYFLQATGEAKYADMIERCVFNAGFGSVDEKFRALQYFSNVNQFVSTGESDHNPYKRGLTWAQYRPTHETECCAGNVNRFLPNYVSRMWMKDRQGCPVAALYGPCEVDYGWVRIAEETRYPFDGKIRFTFKLKEPRKFVFTYRVPNWCVNRKDCGKFVSVNKVFCDGEVMDLEFPMDVVYERPASRKCVVMDFTSRRVMQIEENRSQGVYVRRGPLLYSWPVPEDNSEDKKIYPRLLGKKSKNAAFKCWKKLPAADFGYALVGDETDAVCKQEGGRLPFDWHDPMVTVSVSARRIKWNLEEGRYTPDFPDRVELLSPKVERLKLVPYGATCLRLTMFPDAEDAK